MSKRKRSFKDIIKEKKLMFDIINVILGIVVVLLIVLLFLLPSNIKLVAAAIGAGGAINIMNGYRQISEKRNASIAKSMVTTGAFLMVVAFVLLIWL